MVEGFHNKLVAACVKPEPVLAGVITYLTVVYSENVAADGYGLAVCRAEPLLAIGKI